MAFETFGGIIRVVVLSAALVTAVELVSTQPSAQTLLVHSFQSRHRHSIVMTLHIHVGPGLESFVRKTSFVFIVAILC